MLEAIIQNKLTKENEYLYFKNKENNLVYYGFSIKKGITSPIDKNIINKIYSLLKVNETCIYIEDYLDYKVYLDKENNIKHYLKNGVEDFFMFFKNNGEDLNIYNDSKKNNPNTTSKKFQIGNFIISITSSFLLVFSSIFGISQSVIALLREGTVTNNVMYNLSKSTYSISEYLNLDLNYIDVNEAINLIKSSELPSNIKENLVNEDLFKDIFPYYKDTDMEYIIKHKLKNIKLRIYETDEKYITNPETTNGFYTELVPNVLNVKNIEGYEGVIKHEFIHLLQSNDREYIFLQEALAEICAFEYLDKPIDAYTFCVSNVKLLMDVVGPKQIWETVFSGNSTNLNNILKENLNKKEYNELINYLKNKPQEDVESCARINYLISNLYKNMNNKNIREDINIYNKNNFRIQRIYFNEKKMKENGIYGISNESENFKSINEIFPNQTIRINNNKTK